MDERTLALKAEHEPHGWHVAEDADTTAGNGFRRDGVIAVCACGYAGWVHKDAFELCCA